MKRALKGKTLADIQQISARVKLLPLLSKDIQIGRISIDGAEINLRVAKNGKSNWQSILTALNNETEQKPDASKEKQR